MRYGGPDRDNTGTHMRLAKFLKWWWDKNDWFDRTVAVIISWMIPCAISSIFIGQLGAIIGAIGIIAIMGFWAIFSLVRWIRDQWREFEDKNPTEEIAMLRKLKGIPTPSQRDREYYD